MNRGPKDIRPAGSDLSELRKKIDALDQDLIALLDKRAKVVFEIGQIKKSQGLEVFDPEREQEILQRSLSYSAENLKRSDLQTIYKKIIEQFRAVESVHTQKSLSKLPERCYVGFFGFGLISASVALALKEHRPAWKFLIFDPYIDVEDFQLWKNEQDAPQFDLINEKQLRDLDFVFLGAPVESNKKAGPLLAQKNQCVLNLGSVQSEIKGVYGFHPLAGREVSKYRAAQADLFYNKIICLTNTESLASDKQHQVEMLAQALGAKVTKVSTEVHNKALAHTSHLLQLISIAFGACLENQGLESQLDLIPNSARELLRLAGSNRQMWKSIIEENRSEIMDAIKVFQKKMSETSAALDTAEGVEGLFSKSIKIYEDLYIKRRAS